jgi:hypothetical protein
MNPTQVIILTTIFNVIFSGLVGGIVIYTLQKKIDTTIQKSLFEHQTKFKLSYAKAAETLETLFKRFVAVRDVVSEAIDLWKRSRPEDRLLDTKMDHARELMRDFWKYYRDNRLYLSDEVTSHLDSLDTVTDLVLLNILLTLGRAKYVSHTQWHEEGPPEIIHEWLWDPSQGGNPFSRHGDSKATRYDTPEVMIEEQCKQLNEIAEFLEVSYKSIAKA